VVGVLVLGGLLAACGTTPEPSPPATSFPSPGSVSSAPSSGDGVATFSNPSPSESPVATPFVLHAGCPATAHKDASSSHQPGIFAATTNWSGYVARSTRAFSCIQGSWVQPTVSCPANGSASVAIWIGLDGESGPSRATLEQIGTNTDCKNGRGVSFAWFEILPHDKFEQPLGLDIQAGDRIAASIALVGKSLHLVLEDVTSGVARDTLQKAPGAHRLTAEWVVEAPTVGCPSDCQVSLLASFSTINFRSARAILAGTTGPIGDLRWTRVRLTLESRSGLIKAKPGTLGTDGGSFAVIWHHR
jgi:Peptidase A4 family